MPPARGERVDKTSVGDDRWMMEGNAARGRACRRVRGRLRLRPIKVLERIQLARPKAAFEESATVRRVQELLEQVHARVRAGLRRRRGALLRGQGEAPRLHVRCRRADRGSRG